MTFLTRMRRSRENREMWKGFLMVSIAIKSERREGKTSKNKACLLVIYNIYHLFSVSRLRSTLLLYALDLQNLNCYSSWIIFSTLLRSVILNLLCWKTPETINGLYGPQNHQITYRKRFLFWYITFPLWPQWTQRTYPRTL